MEKSMRDNQPRPEYPRPQFVRKDWMNLNGSWQFETDPGCSGEARGLVKQKALAGQICVPFCMESDLSGIGNKDFVSCVWYKKSFEIPSEAKGKRLLLHFGAADYRTTVWLNEQYIGVHEGGYTSFTMELIDAVCDGENHLTVRCEDDTRCTMQPSGKQSTRFESHGCSYTRTTGIWQTVWLEWVNTSYIEKVFITPDAANSRVHLRLITHTALGCTVQATSFYAGREMGIGNALVSSNDVELTLDLKEKHLWDAGKPELYDLYLTLSKDGGKIDEIASYFGLRSIAFDGMRFLLNGKPVFQRLVLDQGFYPDGIYTAPTDEALKNDILLSMAMGFNGARLHQKVFEARFLYWADHLGYLCWGEMASWGLDHSDIGAYAAFSKEWIEAVERDYSAPSIIGWCPFNETWDFEGRQQNNDVLRMVYRMTKAMDKTRPCIDTSGNFHVETDIFDVHDYEQDPEIFKGYYQAGTAPIHDRFPGRHTYKQGLPVFVSEYGGIRWTDDAGGWGYGEGPKTKEEFIARFKGLTDTLLDNPDHFGLCYTQLTDVEQEQNGLYTYNRKAKFDPAVISAILSRPAACEKKE